MTDPKSNIYLLSRALIEFQHGSQAGDRLLGTVPSQNCVEIPLTSLSVGSVKAQTRVISQASPSSLGPPETQLHLSL